MTHRAKLYAQLAWVFDRDAAALCHEYEDPPVVPTDGELEEAAYLTAIGDDLFSVASALGFEGGTDAAFGYLNDEH